MNVVEAREIIDKHINNDYCTCKSNEQCQVNVARGYLAAFEGEEVTALIAGIEFSLTDGASEDAEKALAVFKKEIQKP